MGLGKRTYSSGLLAVAVLVASVSCNDQSSPTNPRRAAPTEGAARSISDGAHGGNDDVFFLPPMVANPAGKPGFGDAFAPGLPVQIKIRDMTANSVVVGAPGAVTMSLADQLYQANWDTKSPALDTAHVYRVEVWVGAKNLAFADVDLVANGSQLKNLSTGESIGLVDGRTLPIKVRIEQGWNCFNNTSCAIQVVPATIPTGTVVTVKTGDGKNWITFHGGTGGTWNTAGVAAVVTVEDVSGQLGNTPAGCAQGITTMVVQGYCIKITTDPAIILATSAVVCMTSPTALTSWQLLKYDVGPPPKTKFLSDPPAGTCPLTGPIIGSASQSTHMLVRLASRIGNALTRLVTPKPAYAFDLGVGGLLDPGDGFSFFAPGRPAQLRIVSATNNQSASVGTILPLAPAVQIVNTHENLNSPIAGALVTCAVTGGGGSLAAATPAGRATEGPTGTYTCPNWTLGSAIGANTLSVSANIIDAAGNATFTATGGCVTNCPNPNLALKSVVPGDGSTTFNLTVTNRSSYSNALFAQAAGGCGVDQTTSSRTWVDIFDSAGNRIYGFCQLGSAADLDLIWFSAPSNAIPSAVSITLTDRVTNTVYRSNTIQLSP